MKDTRFVTTASAVPDHCTSQPGAPTGGRPHQSPPEKGLTTTKGSKFHLNHKVPNTIVEVHLWLLTPRPCLTSIQTLTPPPPLFVTSGPPSALHLTLRSHISLRDGMSSTTTVQSSVDNNLPYLDNLSYLLCI
ncbi:hypothetical protein Pelo_3129 [Pelomyxa schiedti]|nr:hypothetical protein Pelo_3129 [Pelomyxa schiedti]